MKENRMMAEKIKKNEIDIFDKYSKKFGLNKEESKLGWRWRISFNNILFSKKISVILLRSKKNFRKYYLSKL